MSFKKAFSKALKVYKYFILFFALGFLLFLVIDDWSLLINNLESWYTAVLIWLAWTLIYGIVISLFYWGVATGYILLKFASEK